MQTTPVKYVPTEAIAQSFCVKPETVRRSYCVKNHYMGIKPKKLPNGRLLWPAEALDRVLNQAK